MNHEPIMNFLKNLQNYPEEKRKSLMKLFVILGSLIVIIIWLLLFPKGIEKNKKKEQDWLSNAIKDADKEMSGYGLKRFKKNIDELFNKKPLSQDEERTTESPRLPIEK
ncbi:MAG: hypothetical protein AB1465_01080 [Patescibacteria group bacterium]